MSRGVRRCRTRPDAEGLALADALVDLAVRQTNEGHHAVWDSLSSGKKAVLAAMADDIRPTGSRATERAGLSRATLQSALRELGQDGQHIARNHDGPTAAGYWRFVDPLFAIWVARRGQRRRFVTDDRALEGPTDGKACAVV